MQPSGADTAETADELRHSAERAYRRVLDLDPLHARGPISTWPISISASAATPLPARISRCMSGTAKTLNGARKRHGSSARRPATGWRRRVSGRRTISFEAVPRRTVCARSNGSSPSTPKSGRPTSCVAGGCAAVARSRKRSWRSRRSWRTGEKPMPRGWPTPTTSSPSATWSCTATTTRSATCARHCNSTPRTPRSSPIWGILAMKQGRLDEARRYFATIRELDPNDPLAPRYLHQLGA